MTSIVDFLNETEAKAQALKQDATLRAREATAKTLADAAANVEKETEAAKQLIKQAEAQAEKEGLEIAGSILAEREAATKAMCDAARERLESAASYLVERALEA